MRALRVALVTLCVAVLSSNAARAAGASKLVVSGITTPRSAGSAGTVTVEARTSSGARATSYTGTIRFSSTDSQAVLPANYTFTTADAGIHTFTNAVVLKTAATQSVTATDTVTASITGSQTGIVVNALSVSTLNVSGISTPRTAGTASSVRVKTLDVFGNMASSYRGTIHFTSSDPAANVPADYTFTASDTGDHTFVATAAMPGGVTLKTAGTQSVTVTDVSNASLTASQTGIVVNPAGAGTLVVSGISSPRTVNFASSVTVEARDAYGNRATGYSGTIHFASSDPAAALPANYKFASGDAGIHTFTNGVVLKTVGAQSVTATDTTTASITGSEKGIQVVSNAATTLVLSGFTSPNTAGTSSRFTVEARDAAGNRSTGYTGTLRFTSSDAQASLPADYHFTAGTSCTPSPCDNGIHTFTATLKTAGAQSLTATDTATSSLTATQSGIQINAAAVSALAVFGFPSPVTAGVASTVNIEARDPFGNRVTTYTGSVTVTSSDPQAGAAAHVFTSADAGAFAQSFTLKTAGAQSITASDGTRTGSQTGISVVPAAAAMLIVSGVPSPITAGTAASLTVEAKDAFGNRASGYAGTVQFTSSDPQATVPGNFSFSGSGGIRTFSNGVTLRTAGTQSISAADAASPSIAGSQTGISVQPAVATAVNVALAGGASPVVTAGTPTQATITAFDPYGNIATSYVGTVHFSSSDAAASLPPDHTFVPADFGSATVSGIVFRTAGTQSLSAADTLTPSMVGTHSGISVTSASAVSLSVAGLVSPMTAGAAGSVTVTALDTFGNTATGYRGTVSFSSTDAQAALPAASTFVAADAGARAFAVTLKTVGTQSITGTDTATPSITGTQSGISVTPAAASSFVVSGIPSPIRAGTLADVTVEGRDAYANRATSYLGTVAFTSTDSQTTLPPAYTFQTADSGIHTFSGGVRFATAGTQSVTASDTTATITGTQSGISVLVIDSSPPSWPAGSMLIATSTSSTSIHVAWTAATDNVGVAAYALYQSGLLVQTLPGTALATDVGSLVPGRDYTFTIQAGDAAGNWSADGPSTRSTAVPADPAAQAPALDNTVATNVATSTSFLYSGSNPTQLGVAPDAIEPIRTAVLRGAVMKRSGEPIVGARIDVLGRPELGYTFTRADGHFDLAVNGGGSVTVTYEKSGYLPVQRTATPNWQDYTALPDVTLVPLDETVAAVDFTNSAATNVFRGSPETDLDGTRQPTLIFPPGTHASLVLPDGTVSANMLHIRATEFTVGPSGPSAMPAELPPASAYTYAVEFTADEALQLNAKHVTFSQPIYFYLENFLNFPVGAPIPTGYYDRDLAAWSATPDGTVFKILSVSNGLATVDVNGDGVADTGSTLAALSMTDDERAHLALLYPAGQTLWRVPITHFSPIDNNLPFRPPLDAIWPKDKPKRHEPPPQDDDPCQREGGSTIGCEDQTLAEAVPIAGTPYTLHYKSDRAFGRSSNRTVDIPVSGPSVPGSLKRIDVVVIVAGEVTRRSFSPSPNQNWTFVWNGRDAYGRLTQGPQRVKVVISYVYPAIFMRGAGGGSSFDEESGITFGLDLTRASAPTYSLVLTWEDELGSWMAKDQGLGGWSLNVQHSYSPATLFTGRTLFLGTGERRNAASIGQAVVHAVGNVGGCTRTGGDPSPVVNPSGIVGAPDGSLYISTADANQIVRVSRDGPVTVVAGVDFYTPGTTADGVPATQARLSYPTDLALAPDGTLYFAERDAYRIRRIAPDGIVWTVAGTGIRGLTGDGGPATLAQIGFVLGLALGGDGSLYISADGHIRRVRPDGLIMRFAGYGTSTSDGAQAMQSAMNPAGIAVAPDGSVYVTDPSANKVRRIGVDGTIRTVAGTGAFGSAGDGNLATLATLNQPSSVLAGDSFGSFVVADGSKVRSVGSDGIISSITGDFNGHFNQFGVFVTNDRLLRDGFFWTTAYAGGFYVHGKLARGAEGSLYVGRFNICEVVKITPAVPGFTVNGILLASDDGSELYSFDAAGRHLETRDGLTNTQIRSFAYDAAGRLVGITDRTGNSTQIVRDATGKPYAIVSPYGQTTSLTVDGAGDLIEVRNPAGEAYSASYYEGELLKTFSTPRGLASDFTYDADGRLTMDRGPSRSVFTLSSTRTDTSVTSQVTTAMGLVSTYQATVLPTSGFLRQTTLPGGIVATSLLGIDSSITNTSPDGTVVTMQRSADARYGVQAPVTASFTARTPSGRTLSMVSSRSITQSDLNDPLSLLTLTDRSTVTGRSWTTTYDRGGRTITSTTPTGLSATSVLDGLGRVSEIDSPGVLPLAITYDDRGRLQAVAQGDRTMSLSYDSNGYLSSVRDPLGRFTNLFNDPVGRVLNSSLQGNSTAITYDANGNITSIAPPGRSVHSFTYSGGDLEQDYMPPPVDGSGSGHVHTTRDLDQRIASIAADGVPPIVPSYDAVSGRIVNLAFSAGATSYSYVPASGRVASVTAPGGNTLSYTYDGPVLIATTHTNGPVTTTVNRTYDTAFRLQTETVTGGPTITYTYDNDSKLASAGNLIVTTSPSTGFVVGATLGTVGDSRTYDAFGDVQTYSVAAAGNTAYSANYGTRDQLARVVTKIETILGEQHVYSYSYDSRGRLADVTKDGAPQSHYEYHANGNRIVGPGLSSSPMYDAQDRLLSYGECTYAYRPNGSLQTKACPDGQTIYDYDSFGNLRGAALADGTQITYDIDGENRRIAKQINGVVVERFVYRNQLQPVAWLNGDGSLRAVFVYGEDANVPEYMVSGGNSYRLIRDQVGSVKLVVDSSGTVAQRIDYNEFGNVLADSAPGFQPFGFAGGLRDAHSGLVRFGARDYDPVTGRWTTKDPIRFNGGATNLYTYVDGDPINRRDPTGKVTPLGVRAAALCLAVDLAHGLETVLELNEYADEMLRIREQIKDLRNQCDGQPWDNDRIAKEEEIQQLELEYFKKSDELVRKRVVAYASHAFWAIGCLAVGALF